MTVDAARAAPAIARMEARRRAPPWALAASPVAAVAVGLAAEWLDFRALRYPILFFVLLAVVFTAAALERSHDSPWGAAARTVLVSVLTWGAAESLYVGIHVLRGEPFDADRFGPQWLQAVGLIAVHAGIFGAPTGIAAAIILRLRSWWMTRA